MPTKRTLDLSETLYDYLLNNSLREPNIVRELREETNSMRMSAMQTPPEETQFITWLLQLIHAKRMLEIGIFTGYTTLWSALTMPEDGRIIACDVDEKWTSLGKRYWKIAGVASKIDLRIAPALQTLDQLLVEHYANYFDFVYIDADKENYWNYFERSLLLVRPGGIVGIDNVLWGGSVVNEQNQGSDVCAIRELNARLHHDERISLCMHPIGDGLTLAIRK
jgi:predicted O-methyltransferase YrrM